MTYQEFSDDLSTGCLTLDHNGSFYNSARGLTEHFSVYIYPDGTHVWVSTVDGTTTVQVADYD